MTHTSGIGQIPTDASKKGVHRNCSFVKQLSAQELEQTCRHYLCIRLDRAEAAAKALQQPISMEHCEMVPESRELRLFGVEDSKKVNRFLLEKGFEVEEIFVHKQDLEEYFLNLMGGAANA